MLYSGSYRVLTLVATFDKTVTSLGSLLGLAIICCGLVCFVFAILVFVVCLVFVYYLDVSPPQFISPPNLPPPFPQALRRAAQGPTAAVAALSVR